MSDPTPPAGSARGPDDQDTVEQAPDAVGRAAPAPPPTPPAGPPPPAPPGPPPPAKPPGVVSGPRGLPMILAAVLILLLGIGIGTAGTIGVGLIVRSIHHHGPAAVGKPFPRHGQRVLPPGQGPFRRPGLPIQPVQPGQPINPAPVRPASPAPSPTG